MPNWQTDDESDYCCSEFRSCPRCAPPPQTSEEIEAERREAAAEFERRYIRPLMPVSPLETYFDSVRFKHHGFEDFGDEWE